MFTRKSFGDGTRLSIEVVFLTVIIVITGSLFESKSTKRTFSRLSAIRSYVHICPFVGKLILFGISFDSHRFLTS